MYAYAMSSNVRTNFQPVQQSDILFRYSLTTHEGDWKKGKCALFGWSVGHGFIVDDVHGKRGGTFKERQMSFCSVDKDNVLVSTMKQAEDGKGVIIRLIETEGKETSVTVTVPHTTIENAMLTNLVEEDKVKVVFTPHSVKAQMSAFGITTIRIQP